MRPALRLIVVLAGVLLQPAAAPAQTRTKVTPSVRQTGVRHRWPASPLGRLVEHAKDILVLQVADVDRHQGTITYKATAALKGKATTDPVRHSLGDNLPEYDREMFLEWARPGRIALCFRSDLETSVCVGNA
jgi:hypothetical protein